MARRSPPARRLPRSSPAPRSQLSRCCSGQGEADREAARRVGERIAADHGYLPVAVGRALCYVAAARRPVAVALGAGDPASARQVSGGAGDKPCMDRPTCPFCDSTHTVPVVYGLPGRELEEAAVRGELVLGGCTFSFDAPDRACRDCGGEWETGVVPGWLRSRFGAA